MIPWGLVLGGFGLIVVLVALAREEDQDFVAIPLTDPLHREWVSFLDAQHQG